MLRYYAHLEVCFTAKDDHTAEQNAQWIVDSIKRGFLVPIIEVLDAEIFRVERLEG